MYELKDEFLTGIEMIDTQHRRIFQLAEEAYDLLKNDNMLYKENELAEILQGVLEFTSIHFASEEKYMRDIAYDGLSVQMEQHKAFIARMQVFYKKYESISLANQDEIILEILECLADWLENHIELYDKKIGK